MTIKGQLEELERYYRHRAPEYEALYEREDPIRQGELAEIGEALRWLFKGRDVLEIACGTGYWTEVLSGVVRRLLATDFSQEMLNLARGKKVSTDRVRFRIADAYSLEEIPETFDGAVANFWISHVPRAKMEEFLEQFHLKMGKGARVFMADNFAAPGFGGTFIRRPGVDDTFKLRELSDGSQYEITKNYFSDAELRRLFAPWGTDLEIQAGQYYWWLSYIIR